MSKVSKMMSELSEKDRAFVVRWFVDKYAGQPVVTNGISPSGVERDVNSMVFKDQAQRSDKR
jgi:hypothetical protein